MTRPPTRLTLWSGRLRQESRRPLRPVPWLDVMGWLAVWGLVAVLGLVILAGLMGWGR